MSNKIGADLMKSLDNIQVFNNEKFGQVRVTVIDGAAWMVAADICRALDISNSRDAISSLDEDEKDDVGIPDAIGRVQRTNVVNEFGMYRLIFKSRKPEAKEFQRWVFHEVLPAAVREKASSNESGIKAKSVSGIVEDIVKTATILEDYLGLKKGIAFVHATTTAENLYGVNLQPFKQLAPPAEHETGYMNATHLGEKVGMTARAINQLLKEKGLQFRDGKDWRLTEKGKQFGEELPYDTGKHSGYQIRWGSPAAELFLEDVKH